MAKDSIHRIVAGLVEVVKSLAVITVIAGQSWGMASEQDKDRAAAERASMEAGLLRAKGDPASLRKAVAKYEESLEIRRAIEDRRGEAVTLNIIGVIYDLLGEKQKAIEYFNRALPVSQAAGDRAREARTLNNIALVYRSLGDNQKAIDYHNQALRVSQVARDRMVEGETLNMIGRIQDYLGDKQKALHYYTEALLIFRAAGNRWDEAAILNNIGKIYADLGDKVRAIDYYDHALAVSRAAHNRSVEATTLGNIGMVHADSGDKRKAIDYFTQALSISQAIGDRSIEAGTLHNIGGVYADLGDKWKALDYYHQALPIRRALGDRSGEATTLNNIGRVHEDLGEKQKALDYFNETLLIGRTTGARAVEATALNNIGSVYDSLGDKQKALDYMVQSVEARRAAGDSPGVAVALNNIGRVHDSLGNKQKAIDYYNQALPIARAAGNRSIEATTLNNIGVVYDSLGEMQKALEFYNHALPILRATGNRSVEAITLNNIGRLHDGSGRKQTALDYFNQALPISRSIGNRSVEAITLNNVGGVYYDFGDASKALDCYNQALSIYKDIGAQLETALTFRDIGYVYPSSGEKEKALGYYQQAIANLENTRSQATIEDLKISLSDQSASSYQQAVSLLMQLGGPTEAFELTERARARTFLDQIGNVRPRQLRTANARLVLNEQALAFEINSLARRLRQEYSKSISYISTEVTSSLEIQLGARQREYEELLLKIKLTNPEYTSLRSVDTSTLSEVRRTLNENTTLICYFVASERILAFIIARRSFRAIEIPVKRTELTNSINWFRGFASLRDSHPESLRQLYDWLIAPVKKHIKTPVVGVIPHSVLHYLPFAALTDGRRYFGDQHTIFYLPSASVLPFIQKKSKPVGNQMLALSQRQAEGLPLLKYADEEAEAVADMFSTKALTTGNASKSEFLKQAGNYSILHIAAHAELNTANPIFSRIMLGRGQDDTGALEVRDIYNLDLSKASLVVLSACDTQLGKLSKGDDIVGLNRAFIYAGTPSVMASLWRVDDESTSYVMKAFYTHLK
jgi:CHAT domain-containing protein/tetratricopeptide (TPR) repeat protein